MMQVDGGAGAGAEKAGVVSDVEAFLEKLALNCENRSVPVEGEAMEVRACVIVA